MISSWRRKRSGRASLINMISSWRKKRSGRAATKGDRSAKGALAELVTPNQFCCPISLELMKDPVTISTGITYDRENIEKCIDAGNMTCPLTNQIITTLEPVPNHTLRRMIQDWCVENWSHGVERIPTPRIPISSTQVVELLDEISSHRDHPYECQQLVGKLTLSLKESERNKKCIASNGAARTLSSIFQYHADNEGEIVISLLEDILNTLTSFLPLEIGDQLYNLKTSKSLERLIWFLRNGNLSGRMNAVLILKEVVSSSKDQKQVLNSLVEVEGGLQGLVKQVKEPICPSSTKATLVIIYNMITCYDLSSREIIVTRFVDMGLVQIILDIVVNADNKSECEKGLGVLDGLCRFEEGIKAAHDNALTVPIVVKKILRVSELATEFSVSVLWRLSQNGEEGVVVEALQVGAFQKLLLVLQFGWNINERTKEKVTKLLKLLNVYKEKVECIESADFKDLKRPF